MIKRLHPPVFSQSPLDVYDLLLLGQGFTTEEFDSVAREAWSFITDIRPLNLLNSSRGPGKYTCAVHYDDGTGVDLKISQSGNVLSIPAAASGQLSTYLSGVQVSSDDGSKTDASVIWPVYGSVGRQGSLVAVIKKGDTPGELYQISASPNYPIPMVGVIQAGDNWPMLLARALAQTLGTLADEYELEDADHASPPEGLWAAPPNIIFISEEQRTRLAGGEDSNTVLSDLLQLWPVNSVTSLKFYPHDDTTPNPIKARVGGVQLVEGGGGYRRDVLRADFDCLMRRIPNSSQLPIQDQVPFCDVCKYLLTLAIMGSPNFTPQSAARVALESQRLVYDMVKWSPPGSQSVDLKLQTFPFSIGPFAGSGAKWACTIEDVHTNGLKITTLRLSDRPGDPYAFPGAANQASDVMKSIEFTDLSVTFDNDPPTPLNISDAFANSLARPKLELAGDGHLKRDKDCKIGIKLTLSWDIPGKWAIEVALSLVLGDVDNDFDPGGVVQACKMYPQMSMRYRRPPKGSKKREGKMPKVTMLQGTISLVANNVIPTSLAGSLDPDLQSMASGKQAISLFADSNSSDWDSNYDFNSQTTAGIIGSLFADVPKFGLWTGAWKSGRKLAGVADHFTVKADIAAGTARKAHRDYGKPVLPHWSWLFDYSTPLIQANQHFVGVYRKGDVTKSGNHDGGLPRDTDFDWPVAADQNDSPPQPYKMKVRKVARQGAYDNVHLHADMGIDSSSRPRVAAPFCGDVCMHIHWRWGTVAVGTVRNPLYTFLGWGNGKRDQGAHTIRGAPLIPPNQHLEIDVTPQNPSEALVKYIVQAYDPGLNEPQVFLEQGIGFAFNYNGLPIAGEGLVKLAIAFGIIGASEEASKVLEYIGLKKSDPAKLDRTIRMIFQTIYEHIRWYDPDSDIDNTKTNTVQQIPGVPKAPSALEDL